jgi:hypothetical protein
MLSIRAENDVEDLKGWKQQIIGIGTGVSAIASVVVSGLLWLLEHLHIIHWF